MDGHKLSLASHLSTGSTYQICRICHAEAPYDAEAMVSPCHCAGSLKYVHQECLQQWIKSSNAKSCEICKFQYSMHTKTRPFRQWERLQLDRNEKRRLYMSLLFQTLALFCIGWSIYLIADRNTYDPPKPPNTASDAVANGPSSSSRAQTSLSFNAIVATSSSGGGATLLLVPTNGADGILPNNTSDASSNATFNWPFWAKLSIFALGFAGGFGFMYIQLRMYISMCRKWQAYNKLIYVRNCPDRNPAPGTSSSASSMLTQAQANIQQSSLSQSLGSLQPAKPYIVSAIPPFSHPSTTTTEQHFLFEHGSHHAPSLSIISSTAAQLSGNTSGGGVSSSAKSGVFEQQISSSSTSSSASGGGGGGVLMLTTTNGRHIPGAVVTPNMVMTSEHQPSSTVITITPGMNSSGAAVALQSTTASGPHSTTTVDGYYSALTVYHHHHLAALSAAQQPPPPPPPLQILTTPLIVQQSTTYGGTSTIVSNNQPINIPNTPDNSGSLGITPLATVQDSQNSSTEESAPSISGILTGQLQTIVTATPAITAITASAQAIAAAPAVCHHHHHHHYCHHHRTHEEEQQAAEHAVAAIAPENSTSSSDSGGYSADCVLFMSSSRATEPFVHVHAVTTEESM